MKFPYILNRLLADLTIQSISSKSYEPSHCCKSKKPQPRKPQLKKYLFLGGFIYNREGGGGVFINRGKKLIPGCNTKTLGLVRESGFSLRSLQLPPRLFELLLISLILPIGEPRGQELLLRSHRNHPQGLALRLMQELAGV